MINLPENLTLGVNLERGIQAEKQNKYVTAQKYFQQAVRLDSDNLEANAHLFIAAYYNSDINNFLIAGSRLGGKNIDDEDLFNRVDLLMNKADNYYPSDSFAEIEQKYISIDAIPDTVYIQYIQKNNDKVFAETMYASSLSDRKAYHACDSMLHVILNADDENLSALGIMGSVKRLENQPDSATYYCDQMLRLNNEFIYARCLKARALLKMNRNDQALQLAMDCKKADSTNAYTIATLALVYHFNNQQAQRDAVLRRAERSLKDSTDLQVFQYVHDVINNKESL